MKKKMLFPKLEIEMKIQGYNQKTLGEEVGLGPSSISARLTGKVEFSCREMISISKVLDKPMDYLFSN